MRDSRARSSFPISFRERGHPSEIERRDMSAATYFRQAYGLHLRNRDVRIVCSCQPGDFSAKSAASSAGQSATKRTTRRSGAAPSISLSLRGRRSASLTLIHSRSYVRTNARTYHTLRAGVRVTLACLSTQALEPPSGSVLYFIAPSLSPVKIERHRAGASVDSPRKRDPRFSDISVPERE